MHLDMAIVVTFKDFVSPVAGIILNPSTARAFVNVVNRNHGSEVAVDLVLERLMELDERGELPKLFFI